LPDAMVTGCSPAIGPASNRMRRAVTALAEGSIGRALDLAAAGGVELYRAVLALLTREGGIDLAALHAFADRLARSEAEETYGVVEGLVGQMLARLAITAAKTRERRRAI